MQSRLPPPFHVASAGPLGYRTPWQTASEQVVENIERQAERREKSKNLAPLRALKPFLRPYRGMIAAAGVALVVAAAATLVMPIAVRGVIDHGFSDEDAAASGAISSR